MQAIEEMKEYYGKRAGVYDASMGYEKPRTVERLTPVIDLMKVLLQGGSVLKIACGPCFWTNQVSSVAKSILATDFNESVLEMARRKPLDWNKVTLQVADAYDLPSSPWPLTHAWQWTGLPMCLALGFTNSCAGQMRNSPPMPWWFSVTKSPAPIHRQTCATRKAIAYRKGRFQTGRSTESSSIF